jgi:lambda family phage portal protein
MEKIRKPAAGASSWVRNGLRSYLGAQKVARYADFGASSSGSADYELRNSLTELRSKTRFLARNSPSMVRYIQLMKQNIVGEHGFRFQCRVTRGANGKVDVSLNTSVESAWNDWCDECTVDGAMTMIDLLNQAVETWCRDGEVIWEFVENSRYTDNLSINPLEADMLDEALNTVDPTTKNQIRMGVEIDTYGRPIAYHILTSHPGDMTWYSQDHNQRYRRVPASRIVHMFMRKRAGQTRGEPPAASIINSIKMLDGYREAETMSRRLRAALMGFFTRVFPQGQNITALADQVNPEDGQFEMNMEPGVLKSLPDGYEFSQFDPGGSQTDYAQFEGQAKKDQAMGIGISVMSHGMELAGISYSAGRTVIMEDRDFYKTMQQWFIRVGIRHVFRRWLKLHSLQDDSSVPPTRINIVRRMHIFRPRGWDWVDPAKDVKANAEALATSQTSLSRVAAARGIDRDDLLREIAEDQAAAKELGLTLTYTTGMADNNNNDDDDDDEDKNDVPNSKS